MSEFKREKRYQVIKLSNPNWKGSCVVVEDDFPEYEIVWKMIQDRVEGKPNIIEQLQAELAATTAGKVTIVKEKFYPADKELIEKLQADNAQLREACIAAESAFITQVGADYNNVVHAAVLKLKQVLISTESNWLDEQKAQWRREYMSDNTDFAWLIENAELANVQYWTGQGVEHWSFNPNEAMRFVRKEDAERALGWLVPARHYTRIAQHGWMRRLAEQPESKCACYPDDKDADKHQCNECPR